jgi:hypothetical protein
MGEETMRTPAEDTLILEVLKNYTTDQVFEMLLWFDTRGMTNEDKMAYYREKERALTADVELLTAKFEARYANVP